MSSNVPAAPKTRPHVTVPCSCQPLMARAARAAAAEQLGAGREQVVHNGPGVGVTMSAGGFNDVPVGRRQTQSPW